MACNAGPDIIEDGLVLCLDAANINSYPKTGTTWTDLAGNNNVTLTNGPVFDSNNGGSIGFDGGDDYAKNDSPDLPTGNVTATICAWLYRINTSSQWQGIAGWGNRNTSQSALLDMNQSRLAFSTWGSVNSQDVISTYTVPANTWKYVVGSISNKNIKLYQDGIKVLDQTLSSTPNVTSTQLRIATTDYPGRLLQCNIAAVQIYNRVLSDNEIRQNHEATAGRFV
jgi:hypothetical protein